MTMRPIFLLSQPRAGSTLVQRVLSGYDEIATVNEPWILLPLLSPLREGGIRSHYPHWLAHVAIQDFAQAMDGGMRRLEDELGETALRLYEAASGPEARFFLDKTPAYHVIAPLLHRVFPDAAFIYLWRNPLSVLASVLETWGEGRFVPHVFRVDLFDAVENLVASFRQAGGAAVGVRYEDLVAGDEEWQRVTASLGLDWDPELLTNFAGRRLHGRMGDPTGVQRYQALSSEPLDKWQATLDNPVRRAWARRYLRWIGESRLTTMGYDLADLEASLGAARGGRGRVLRDVAALAPSLVTEPLRARAFQDAGGGNTWRMISGGSSVGATASARRRTPPPPPPEPQLPNRSKTGEI